jgi:hypothetical protein
MHKTNYRRLQAMTWCFALGLSSGAAGADTPNAAAAPYSASPQAEQRVRQDMQAALTNLGSSGALGQHPDKVAVSLDEPARRVTSLGALVDSDQCASSATACMFSVRRRAATPIASAFGPAMSSSAERRRRCATSAPTSMAARGSIDAQDRRRWIAGRCDAAVAHRARWQPVTLSGPLEPVYLPAMHVELGGAVASADAAPRTACRGPGSVCPEGCGRIACSMSPRGEHLYGCASC